MSPTPSKPAISSNQSAGQHRKQYWLISRSAAFLGSRKGRIRPNTFTRTNCIRMFMAGRHSMTCWQGWPHMSMAATTWHPKGVIQNDLNAIAGQHSRSQDARSAENTNSSARCMTGNRHDPPRWTRHHSVLVWASVKLRHHHRQPWQLFLRWECLLHIHWGRVRVAECSK